MKPKHTPLPWSLQVDGTGVHQIAGGRAPDPITEARYEFIATLHYGGPVSGPESLWRWTTFDEMRANAAFLCRAVNAHYELLEAAERAIDYIEEIGTHAPSDARITDPLRTAIAKAKEKPPCPYPGSTTTPWRSFSAVSEARG